jgi:uncharacterized protein
MNRLAILPFVLLLLAPPAGATVSASAVPARAAPTTATPQALPFAQAWTNTALITANDDWAGVPGLAGYR